MRRTEHIMLRLRPETAQAIQRVAEREDRAVAVVARRVIEAAVKVWESQETAAA